MAFNDSPSPLGAAAFRDRCSRLREVESTVRVLAQAFEHCPACVAITDPQGVVKRASRGFCLLCGYDLAGVIGQSLEALLAGPTLAAPWAERWQEIIASDAWTGTLIYKRKDGTLRPAPATIRAIAGNNRGVIHYLVASDEVSLRAATEAALRESEERYRLLAENATDVIVRMSPDMRILYVSPSIRQVLGYEPESVLGLPAIESVHPDDREVAAHAVARALAWPAVQTAVYRSLRADGSWAWVETTGRVIRDDVTGAVVELQASVRDVSARKQAEDALRRSEARYRGIIETAQEGIWELDGVGRITFANKRLAELLGYSPREMLGRSPWDFVPAGDQQLAFERQQQRLQGPHETVEVRYWHKDGRTVWARMQSFPLLDDHGAVAGTVVMAADVTAQRAADQAQARLAAIVESLPDAIISASAETVIESWNAGAVRLYGYTEAEAIGRPISLIFPPDRPAALRQIGAELVQGRDVRHLETVQRHKDGHDIDVVLTVALIRDATGAVVGSASVTQDISDRKRSEAALRESERRYRLLAENATDVISLFSSDMTLLYVSPSAHQVLRADPAQVVGRPVMDFVHPDDREAITQLLTRVTAQPVSETLVWRTLCGDGMYRWVESTARALRDQQTDEVREVQTATRDISARKQAEDALRQSEARFRRIVETSLEAIYQLDADDRVVFGNERFTELTGYTLAELAGTPVSDLVVPEDRGAGFARAAARREGALDRSQYEKRWLRKDGTARWVHESAVPIRDDQGRYAGLLGMATDIHERKLAEQALQEYARERLERARVAEALAEVSSLLSSSLAFESVPASILTVMARVIPCATTHVFAYRDGQVEVAGSYGEPSVPLGTVVSRLDAGEGIFPRTAGEAIVLGETRGVPGWRGISPWVGEHEVRSVILLPLLVHGEVYACLAVGSTMPEQFTERHLEIARAFAERIAQALWNARLYQLEQQRARAAEHLAALRNEFVATASHELRTPLAVALGFAETLDYQWDRLSEAQRRQHVQRIVQAANRQKRLVDDLLRVSTLEAEHVTLQRRDVLLFEVVAQAIAVMNASYPDQEIDAAGPPALTALVDRMYAEQVLINLLDNAAKYGGEGSGIVVEWTAEDGMAVVRVRDHGPGIPQEGRGLLFTRFGRIPGSGMRAGHVGTGLGLYLGRAYAEAMGGSLELESSGPRGSVFALRLPLQTL